MLTRLQTCRLFRPASLNLDTELVLQMILLQEDPAIRRMFSMQPSLIHTPKRAKKNRITTKEETKHFIGQGVNSYTHLLVC